MSPAELWLDIVVVWIPLAVCFLVGVLTWRRNR